MASVSDFEQGQSFSIEAGGQTIVLELSAVNPIANSPREGGGFTLLFRGPRDVPLQQAIYRFTGKSGAHESSSCRSLPMRRGGFTRRYSTDFGGPIGQGTIRPSGRFGSAAARPMIDYIEIADIFDEAACSALCAEIRAAVGRPAGLLGRSGQKPAWPEVRRTARAEVSQATEERVSALLAQQKVALERHFGLVLGQVEKPQFLHYREGDFFVPHQDGNTPLIHDELRFRKIRW